MITIVLQTTNIVVSLVDFVESPGHKNMRCKWSKIDYVLHQTPNQKVGPGTAESRKREREHPVLGLL